MKRKIIILSIMLCLAFSGVIYANWNDNLQLNSKLKTGALDFESIDNLQISLIGQNGAMLPLNVSKTKQEDKFLLEINDNFDIVGFIGADNEQPLYQSFQISYDLLPSQWNTIDKLSEDYVVEEVVMAAENTGNAFNLKWICERTIRQENDKISITHIFTLSQESKVENATYVENLENDYKMYQLASMDRWNTLQQKLDGKNLVSLINEKEENSLDVENLDTAKLTEQFFQEYTLGSKEVNYNFAFNVVVTQAPQTVTSNLFTYGLWTEDVLFDGWLCITYPELVKNAEYLNVEEFEKLDLLKDVTETIEEPQTSESEENIEIIIEIPQENNTESQSNVKETNDLITGETTKEEPSELNIGETTEEEPSDLITGDAMKEETSELTTGDTTKEEPSDSITGETTKEEPSELNIGETTEEEPSDLITDDATKEESSVPITEEVTGESSSESNTKSLETSN